MRKMVALVLVLAVAAVFAVPAFAGTCSSCVKPGCVKCPACAQPCPQAKPCPTCGQPCNILQSTANVITSMEAPCLCPKCSTPCPKCTK